MKVKAIKTFYDKEAKIKREPGKAGEVFEASAKRVNEINRKGRYIELVEDEAPATTKK